MAVLSRELDSYRRAVDAYQRRLNSHNRTVQAYEDTVARDAMGDRLVVDDSGNVYKVDRTGKLTPSSIPEGTALEDMATSEIPGEDRFRVLRLGGKDADLPERPEDFKGAFNRQAPNPSFAQAAKASAPSLAQVEAGLIGEVMRGSGPRGGVPIYRAPGNVPPDVETITIFPEAKQVNA